ncbi:MAG: FtsQ-type POTRA domain-containing protein [Alkalinema sp. CAN_BIN05]|nr:FtsQ-type POTRA domain-containing protein [Alkalinema sp. CAN_BIN05]
MRDNSLVSDSMPDIAPVTRNELQERRRQLKTNRRNRLLQTSWRSVVVLGLAAATVWIVLQPNWVIRRSEQVKIEGNRLLSSQTIRSLLPIQYPQSLLRIQSSQISDALTSKAPIVEAVVERHLFPPGLIIKIREREPVAQAIYGSGGKLAQSDPKIIVKGEKGKATDKSNSSPNPNAGNLGKAAIDSTPPDAFLDEEGMILPIEGYTEWNQGIKMPDLKILGNPDVYRRQWTSFYPILRRSPVRIQSIDWQSPTNIRLKTEMGWIHLGPLGRSFTLQMRSLDKMRQLPKRLPPEQIDYIDLRNPNNPTIQLKNSRSNAPKSSEESGL